MSLFTNFMCTESNYGQDSSDQILISSCLLDPLPLNDFFVLPAGWWVFCCALIRDKGRDQCNINTSCYAHISVNKLTYPLTDPITKLGRNHQVSQHQIILQCPTVQNNILKINLTMYIVHTLLYTYSGPLLLNISSSQLSSFFLIGTHSLNQYGPSDTFSSILFSSPQAISHNTYKH